MKQKIHIFGASGSGTTTIAKVVCKKTHYRHFDSDSYFWLSTDNPFTVERPREECLALMENDLKNDERWILSGSLVNWGNVLIPLFDLVVFVYIPKDIRLARLEKREYERHGDAMLSGGSKYENSKNFLEWAASYDSGIYEGRSLLKHEEWLKNIKCCVLRITNFSLNDSVNAVLKAINTGACSL